MFLQVCQVKVIEFREPWFLEGNKWWNMPWSRISLANYLRVKTYQHTHKIQTIVVSWEIALLLVPMIIESASFESGFMGGQYSEACTRARARSYGKRK